MNLIEIGCTGQELVDKINELVAAFNGLTNVTSYNDLTDKPSVNGVTLSGALETKDLGIEMTDLDDYAEVMDTLATTGDVDDAKKDAVAEAVASVKASLAAKLDTNPSNLSEVTNTSDDAYVYIYVDGAAKKVTLGTLVKNVGNYVDTKSTLDKVVTKDGSLIALKGSQDGKNTDFKTDKNFIAGTSCVYYNGQLLTRGTDYVEVGGYQITMLTHIPTANDVLRMVAVVTS